MKRIIAFLFTLIACATAANRTLEWDANAPGDLIAKYVLYEKLGPGWAKVDEVPATETAIIIAVLPGQHTYAVTAVNFEELESERSNELTFVEPLPPPANLRVRIAAVKASTDMATWQTVALVNVPELPGGRTFYQLAFAP